MINIIPNNIARPGRPPKLSPSDKQSLKLSSLRERRKSDHPSFSCEKATQHCGSERMCICQEPIPEKKERDKIR